MSNFNTVASTVDSTSSDNYLVQQGGVDYKQTRSVLAKGIAKEIYQIGDLFLSMNAANPSLRFGGTWVLVTGDATLSFGDGTAQSSTVSGSNTKAVPIAAHAHTMNHDHPSATTSTYTHSHSFSYSQPTNDNSGGWSLDNDAARNDTDTTSYDSHNHTFNVPNYIGNTGITGTSNATMDVKGATISVNVWRRTA